MKRKMLFVVVTVVALLAGVLVAAAQSPRSAESLPATLPPLLGTGFTYQGQLKSSGAPVNATCSFIFKLFNDPAAGAQFGSNVTTTTPITNGLFTTVVDFGAGAITGNARWLDMQVKCPPAGSYTPLSPRQALTPAPMALALPGLWTQQNPTSTNLIGGYSGNYIAPGLAGGTIGGGGMSGAINSITATSAFFAYSSNFATIGGGVGNVAALAATVGGGSHNTATAIESTVGGGGQNKADNGPDATVGGGSGNTASGWFSTVPGGSGNTASGDNSFAAGTNADTNNQTGTFVWADDSVTPTLSATAPNQFLIRAAGGVGIGTDSPKASLEVISAQTTGADNTATFGNPSLGPNYSHIHYGITGDWYIRSASPTGTVVLQDAGGSVGIGAAPNPVYKLDVAGKMRASGFSGVCRTDGVVAAGPVCNQDVAETFAAAERTKPGDLVVLAARGAGAPTVRKSAQPYDSLLVGVVSQNPGLIFDAGQTHLAGDNTQLITDDQTVVALVGRVLVNVSLENGPIALGDPLTSAAQPGMAMKATRAGKIIGYALEAAGEAGQVLLLVQPGYYAPEDSLPAQNSRLQEQNAQLQAKVNSMERQNETTQARLAALEQARPQEGGALPWLLAGGLLLTVALLLRRSFPHVSIPDKDFRG